MKIVQYIKENLRESRLGKPLMFFFIIILDIYSLFVRFFFSVNAFLNALKFYLYNDWLTNFPSNFIRILYLRNFLKVKLGKSNFIHLGCRFEGNIIIGNNNVIGRNCVFKGDITLKNNISITAETYIFTSSHIANDTDFKCFYKTVVIHDHAWIGVRAIIMPGVEIGRGAILGASSVLTKNIPDFNIFAGVPAKYIGIRNSEIDYTLTYFPFFQ